jgi:hypothetical protein
VLVEVTESVQPPQRMRFVGCPSAVRLKRQDFSFRRVGNSISLLSESLSAGAIVDLHDRKLRPVGVENTPESFCKTPNELIEARSHVVAGIPHDEADVIGHVQQLAFETIPLLLKVFITPESVCLIPGEIFEERIESIKVRLRPTKFQVGIKQSRKMGSD